MNIIGFLDVPSNGNYIIDGCDTTKLSDNNLASLRNEKIGFIFQSFNLLSNLSAAGNVELPLIYSSKPDRKKLVYEALEKVTLNDRSHHKPKELSGGQQQRVAIARALVNKPSLILADEPTGALDSKTGKEIMALLTELNSHGITIIMVTHDANVASYADRIIEIKDGEIVSDRKNKHDKEEEHDTEYVCKKRSGKGVFLSPTELIENIGMAVYSIFSNKLRTFLTMLGVIIGVASVISMISIGEGASARITENISKMGANLLMIMPGSSTRGPVRSMSDRRSLTYEDMVEIESRANLVVRADANFSRNQQIVYQNRNWNTRVEGSTPNFPLVRNFEVETGSFFTDEDNRLTRRVAVLGKTVAKELFPGEDPIGEYIRIRNDIYQVVGVLVEKGSSGWRDEDDLILIPLLTAMKRQFGVDYVSQINVSIVSNDYVEEAVAEITAILRETHRLREGQEDDFSIRAQAEILETVNETTKSFTFLLAGIAVVSLVVGGIGIMNIMLVSVTERTREIGIRKAIGARGVDILMQFLIEAILVSVTGGAIGILVGVGVGHIISNFAGWQTIVSQDSVMVAFLFSTAVGLFFGFYPAKKASGLNPIDALRYE
jgi:macrolide transport system ATP-binding/permease protein